VEKVGRRDFPGPTGRRHGGIVDEADALPRTLGENGAEFPLDRRACRGHIREIERQVPILGSAEIGGPPCDPDHLPAALQQFAGHGGADPGARAGYEGQPPRIH
jgi:hypothetical protein